MIKLICKNICIFIVDLSKCEFEFWPFVAFRAREGEGLQQYYIAVDRQKFKMVATHRSLSSEVVAVEFWVVNGKSKICAPSAWAHFLLNWIHLVLIMYLRPSVSL